MPRSTRRAARRSPPRTRRCRCRAMSRSLRSTRARRSSSRVERRGPMTQGRGWSRCRPVPLAQLGLPAGAAPVRVRRVNPPETERAAAARRPTAPRPDGDAQVAARRARAASCRQAQAAVPSPRPSHSLRAPVASPPAAVAPPARAATHRPPPQRRAATARLRRAGRVAAPAPAAGHARVGPGRGLRPGACPAPTRAAGQARRRGQPGRAACSASAPARSRPADEAEAALAKVRAAGYSDARILRADGLIRRRAAPAAGAH